MEEIFLVSIIFQRTYKLVFQRWNDALTHITVECPTKFFFGVSQKCPTLRLDKWMVRMFEYGFEENIDYIPQLSPPFIYNL